MKVLIVEDDGAMCHFFTEVVRGLGCEVRACADAETAWQLCQQETYPLLLLDWLLPGMDGLELCRRIRTLPNGDRCVILMITARDQATDLQEVLEAGADDYLTKPVERSLLKIRLTIAQQRVQDLEKRKRAETQVEDMVGELQKSHGNLLSILNQLDLGTAISDGAGRITFLNQAAERIFAVGRGADALGQFWHMLFPLRESDQETIRALCARPPTERTKVSVQFKGRDGQPHWMKVEVQNDPRDDQQRIFIFYDLSEVYDLRQRLEEKVQFHDLIGKSKSMQAVYQRIQEVVHVDWTVLIEGETGTGKELVARAIHFASPRSSKPFIAVNCAALTDSLIGSQLFGHKRGAFTGASQDHKGYFESAHGGTLLLDEIGDLPASIQASLLRVLEEKEITRLGESKGRKVDVRILAATHRDLEAEVAAGRFRQDLLYRIRIGRIQLPALRQRREDISLLVNRFLRQCSAATGREIESVEREAMRKLVEYDWPGNVRELENAIEFASVRCAQPTLQLEDLPPELHQETPDEPADVVDAQEMEKQQMLAALQQTRGNRTEAAQLLGISRATLYRRLARLGIASIPQTYQLPQLPS